MGQIERQQMVLNILRNLRDLGGHKKLFWEELNYEHEKFVAKHLSEYRCFLVSSRLGFGNTDPY